MSLSQRIPAQRGPNEKPGPLVLSKQKKIGQGGHKGDPRGAAITRKVNAQTARHNPPHNPTKQTNPL